MTDVDFNGDALDAVVLDAFAPLGVHAMVTTRSGGISTGPYASLNLGGHVGDKPAHVEVNRSRLASAMGVTRHALVIANQVHGADVAVVRAGDDPGDVDVLVTSDPSIAVCVLVADCVPAVVVDPVASVLAVIHAGWRGVAAQTMAAGVAAITAQGGDPDRCHAYLGARISPRAYEVGEEVAAAFHAVDCGDDVAVADDGHIHVDLAGACRRQLVASGVRPGHVTVSQSVTDGGDRFFSDRASRPCGRFAIAARLEGRS